MYPEALRLKSDPRDIVNHFTYLREFSKEHPDYFVPIGTMIFCGKQGSGKTLSGVNYVYQLRQYFPKAILVTNVAMKDYPFNTTYKVNQETGETDYFNTLGEPLIFDREGHFPEGTTIEWDGLDCLKYINNGYYGVIYFVDELHLELNSLESKNIDIDVMTEISQQRKQRKHIIGTSQVYMRLAKPLREQIFNVVLCNCWFGWLQYNKLIDGEESQEKDGKLDAVVRKRVFWIHKPEYYSRYDTFAKMKRLNDQWQGHKREVAPTFNFQVKGVS